MQQNCTSLSLKARHIMLAALCIFSLKSFSQKDIWTLQQLPGLSITPRSGAFTFTIGNKAYIGTGSSDQGYKKDFWEFDVVSNTWSQKADFGGQARESAVGFSIGNKGYAGTGMVMNQFTEAVRDFWMYDPLLNTWVQKANLSGNARFGAVGFAIKEKGYIATGYDFTSVKGDC